MNDTKEPEERPSQARYVYGQFAEHAKGCKWCTAGIGNIQQHPCRRPTSRIQNNFCPTGHLLLDAIFN